MCRKMHVDQRKVGGGFEIEAISIFYCFYFLFLVSSAAFFLVVGGRGGHKVIGLRLLCPSWGQVIEFSRLRLL